MPPFIQNILALPAKTKAILAVSAVAIIGSRSSCSRSRRPRRTRRSRRASIPPRRARSRPRSTSRASPTRSRTTARRLAVTKAQMSEARIALASQGVEASSGGAQPGYELLDESKLGASQFQQQVTYQRALEGEVAKSLKGVQGVSNPNVQIVMPQDDLFQDEATPATRVRHARQLRRHAGARRRARHGPDRVRLREGPQVRERDHHRLVRRHPVAVRRGRRRGRRLRRQAGRRGALRPAEGSRDQRDARLHARPGQGARSRSTPTSTSTRPAKRSSRTAAPAIPLTDTTERPRRWRAPARQRGRHRRHRLQRPDLLGQRNGSAAGSGNYENAKKTSNNGVNKTITKTQKAAGAVNKMNVALLIDKSVPANVATALEQTVATAAGVDTTRGDTITSTQMAFAKPATPKAGPVPTDAASARQVGRPGPRRAAVPLLHDPRDEEAREREPDAGLADRDRRAGLPGSARGGRRPGFTLDQAATKMLPPRARTLR